MQRAVLRGRELAEHDEELRDHAPLGEILDRHLGGARSSVECLARACELYAHRSCFAERASSGETGEAGELEVTTYAQLWRRVESAASGLRGEGLADTGDFVGICGFGSVDWVVADLACLYLSAVSVPIPTSLSRADLRALVNEASLRCVVCSLAQLELLTSVLPDCPSVMSVVVIDVDARDPAAMGIWELARQTMDEEHGAALAVLRLAEVEQRGRSRGLVPYVDPARRRGREPDPLMTLMYTSGSTGTPKGAMFPESLWREVWCARSLGDLPPVPCVGVNYLPLDRVAGRGAVVRSIRGGGLLTFVARRSLSTLFEDIRRARPTSLMLVPRVAGLIHQRFQSELVKRGGARRDAAGRRAIESEIMAEMRGSFLGDRLVYAMSGTAPTAPEVRDFIERCFELPMFDGYGSTEAGVIAADGRIVNETVTEIKLASAPELGYCVTDAPFPRGELCVKSSRMIPGYYRSPEATRDLFDQEGFLKTGDIVERRGPDEIAWIDRRKNVMKLAQGEFVSPSRLELLYAASSPFLRQVYIHGDSLRAYLLAVIVPERDAVEVALRERGQMPDEAAVKALVRDELARVAREASLRSFEIPRDFLIEPGPFSRQNGLVTESEKPIRRRLRARYGARLDRLYAAIEQAQVEELYDVAGPGGEEGSVAERIWSALKITLGVPDLDSEASARSFVDLGGDSLSALRFVDLIKNIVGIEVPVATVLDPTLSSADLVQAVDQRREGPRSRTRASFAQIHGAGAKVVHADDLRLERFFGHADFAAAQRALPAVVLPAKARVTLLTGATGFLGRFLALALLERASRSEGKVVCLVRAQSDHAALDRLRASYRGPDPALWSRFLELSSGRLTVVHGDLAKPRLGLADDVYDRLCGEVDSIVHSGALVNHALSYPQLFEPNVLGTVELMRLATRWRIKAMSVVSTVGVAGGLARNTSVREDEDGRALWRDRPIDGGHGVGYATSKWACEVLLRELSDRLAVPVEVFRCSMILPSGEFVGQVNVADLLTRLLVSVVLTRLAPRSFYAGDARRAHFDGLPVDFVAESLAAVSASARSSYTTYHVVNAHWDDGVSLDRLVDWVVSAGYPVARVADHAAWLAAFRARLEELPVAMQQRSALPIVHAWARPIPVGGQVLFEARRLRERLEDLGGGPVEMPCFDEARLHAYLRDLRALGLIDAPPVSERAKGAA